MFQTWLQSGERGFGSGWSMLTVLFTDSGSAGESRGRPKETRPRSTSTLSRLFTQASTFAIERKIVIFCTSKVYFAYDKYTLLDSEIQ